MEFLYWFSYLGFCLALSRTTSFPPQAEIPPLLGSCWTPHGAFLNRQEHRWLSFGVTSAILALPLFLAKFFSLPVFTGIGLIFILPYFLSGFLALGYRLGCSSLNEIDPAPGLRQPDTVTERFRILVRPPDTSPDFAPPYGWTTHPQMMGHLRETPYPCLKEVSRSGLSVALQMSPSVPWQTSHETISRATDLFVTHLQEQIYSQTDRAMQAALQRDKAASALVQLREQLETALSGRPEERISLDLSGSFPELSSKRPLQRMSRAFLEEHRSTLLQEIHEVTTLLQESASFSSAPSSGLDLVNPPLFPAT